MTINMLIDCEDVVKMDYQVRRLDRKRGIEEIFAELEFDILIPSDIDLFGATLRQALERVYSQRQVGHEYLRLWVRTRKTSVPRKKRKNPGQMTPKASGNFQICGLEDLDRRIDKIVGYLSGIKDRIPTDGMRIFVQLSDRRDDLTPILFKAGDEDSVKPIV